MSATDWNFQTQVNIGQKSIKHSFHRFKILCVAQCKPEDVRIDSFLQGFNSLANKMDHLHRRS